MATSLISITAKTNKINFDGSKRRRDFRQVSFSFKENPTKRGLFFVNTVLGTFSQVPIEVPMKKKTALKLSIAVLPLLLASCSAFDFNKSAVAGTSDSNESTNTNTSNNDTSVTTSTSKTTGTSSKTSSSTSIDPDVGGTIVLSDSGSTVSGKGASVNGSTVTISQASTWSVSGSLSNGTILIDADDDGTVELDLNDVSITKSGTLTYAPISSINGEKLKIKKESGSTNTIIDNRTSADATAKDTAAIFSNKKLSVVGSGTLTVKGNLNNGVASDTKIEAKNGTLNVTAKNNAIKAHDYILLGDPDDQGTFNVTSTGGDGVKVDEDYTASMDSDEFAGIKLQKGAYTISAYDDGIDSAGNVYIEDGSGTVKGITTTQSAGSKGIHCDLAIYMDGGEFTFYSAANDAINATGNVTVSGGTYTLTAGKTKSTSAPQGIHSDATVNITGGLTTITQSYEGIEALDINISGGTTSLTSTDDGLNAAGGNDSSGSSWGTTSATPTITISGGYLYVAAAGDGIDSNGNIVVTGGFTVVSQTGSGNGPMDYGDGGSYSFKQSGGFLAAYGSNDMAVGSTGTQYSLLAGWSSAVSTSQYLIVTNSNGTSYAIKPQYASAYSLYISSDGFKAGSVSVSSVSSISGGNEIFKGVYTGYTTGTTTSIGSSTWSTSAVNLSIGSTSSHGGPGGGPGGGR
jgi:hypothetical protein